MEETTNDIQNLEKLKNTIADLKTNIISDIAKQEIPYNQLPSTKKDLQKLLDRYIRKNNFNITATVLDCERTKAPESLEVPDGKGKTKTISTANSTICEFTVVFQGENTSTLDYLSFSIPNEYVKEDETEKEQRIIGNVKVGLMFIVSLMLFVGTTRFMLNQITPFQTEREATNFDDTTAKEGEKGNFSYYLLNRKTKTLILKKDEDKSFNDTIYDNLITALMVLEKLKLSEMEKTVTVDSSELSKVGNSEYKINLVAGEEITVNSLLDALFVTSAEDAREVLKSELEKVTGESYEALLEKKEQMIFQNEQFSNAEKLTTLLDYIMNRSYVGGLFKNRVGQQEYIKPPTNKCKGAVHFDKMFKSTFMEKEGIHIYCIYAKESNGKGACILFCAENSDNQQLIGTVYSDNTNKKEMQEMVTNLIRDGFKWIKTQDGIGENDGEDRS